MEVVSLNMAAALVGVSTRTLRRRIADRTLVVAPDVTDSAGRTFLPLADLENNLRISLTREDWALVQAADMGQAQAQCELGLMMIEQDMLEEGVRWLRQAAEHFYPEAMYQLGCLLLLDKKEVDGAPDYQAAQEMIERAAQHGHVIASHVLSFFKDGQISGLFNQIEAEEQQIVLRALNAGAF